MGDDLSDEREPFELQPTGPIPRELHSEYEDRPFKICTRCGETLADFNEGYRVSKIYRSGEVIFEYALCVPCLRNIMEESSEESRQRLLEYQMSRLHPTESNEECALCDHTRSSARNHEFGLVAVCQGEGLVEANMVCVHCMEEMSELVSEQTRSTWDRFVEENFPGVPADLQPFPARPTPPMVC